jgi:hypothetical protein
MTCPGCGIRYDYEHGVGFNTGLTFKEVRRMIIAIGVDRKTGKTKYGRRNGTLGYMHELKKTMWKAHVAECVEYHRQRRTA